MVVRVKSLAISHEERFCSSCELIKHIDQFHFCSKGSQKRQAACKSCAHEKYKKTFCRNRFRNNKLKSRYGISLNDYKLMELDQEFKCLICSAVCEEDKLNVDHCHTNGNVRGLLCGNCNKGLGSFKENTNSLKNAIKYLEDNRMTNEIELREKLKQSVDTVIDLVNDGKEDEAKTYVRDNLSEFLVDAYVQSAIQYKAIIQAQEEAKANIEDTAKTSENGSEELVEVSVKEDDRTEVSCDTTESKKPSDS